jgi:hypothetical protein
MNTAETAEAMDTFVMIGSPPLEPCRSGSRRQTVCLVAIAMGIEACLRVTDVEEAISNSCWQLRGLVDRTVDQIRRDD